QFHDEKYLNTIKQTDSSTTPPTLVESTTGPTGGGLLCSLQTLVTAVTNGSYIISDRIYNIATLDQTPHTEMLAILRPIQEHRCITVRIQSQLQPNSTELVEGVLEIFCGLKLVVQFSFWINRETGCTELFFGNVRVDLERCGTIEPARPESFYRLQIESSAKIIFQLGFAQSPALQESVPLPNHELKEFSPASIEDMFKCDCTLLREAFKTLKMCVVGSVNNITKLVIHISVIVSIAAATTCLLILIVWVTLLENIKAPDQESKSTIMAINLILQFLYFELRQSNRVRKWFHRKLSLELDELISKTTTGKLFDKLTIRDLDLGSQFPEIKNFRLHAVDLHPDEGHIESLDVLLDLHYEGNFRLTIDADMVLGKKGSLALRVKQVSGLARLQFTRKPYTHWSLSFINDPKVELDVQSHFQGRQMQSNITSLISNQIRKAIRRKHTLPNYKLRYKPFFHRVEEDYELNEIVPNGTLEVTIAEISRLNAPVRTLTHVYCTLTLAHMPWVVARHQDDANVMIVALDIEIHKAKNQQIGIVFKQTDQSVLIDAVIPNTPASKAELRRGDVLLSIQGKRVTNINQVPKVIKALNRPMFVLRIERLVAGQIKNDALLDDFEADFEEIDPNLNITFVKNADTVQIGGGAAVGTAGVAVLRERKLVRRNSKDNSGGESSHSNTPGTTPVKKASLITSSAAMAEATPRGSFSEPSAASKAKGNVECYPQHSSVDAEFNSFIRLDDPCTFQLMEKYSYLNLSVFGKSNEENRLLGYLNIPINSILLECNESHLGHHLKKYPLLPPEAIDVSNHPLSMQSGFDQNYCYGDVLLSFVWNGNALSFASPTPSKVISAENKKQRLITISRGSADKLDDDRTDGPLESKSPLSTFTQIPPQTQQQQQQHDFIRTHFHRTTQCDYCGKKIWLKDAVQCRDCAMCCHKKCINKCQSSTVCTANEAGVAVADARSSSSAASLAATVSPVSAAVAATAAAAGSLQPEFKVTEPESPTIEVEDFVDIAEEQQQIIPKSKLETHRQSFSDLLVQGLKRVNSANNLSIPSMAGLNPSSKSLPPTPQHTPRKQSLANVNANPFLLVTQRLEALPEDVNELNMEQIVDLTAPLIEYGPSDTLMGLAKSTSKTMYGDCESDVRTEKINKLVSTGGSGGGGGGGGDSGRGLSKLHIALDYETINQSVLNATKDSNSSSGSSVVGANPNTKVELADGKGGKSVAQPQHQQQQQHDSTRSAFLAGQSEERVQALSIIMLHLCSGLQYVQGNLGQ
uniref:PDZ domain-containing protein 8 n=1 Tax=Anopheles dirus TaxID=7168 RepID=A0A182NRJ8_9DIPT